MRRQNGRGVVTVRRETLGGRGAEEICEGELRGMAGRVLRIEWVSVGTIREARKGTRSRRDCRSLRSCE